MRRVKRNHSKRIKLKNSTRVLLIMLAIVLFSISSSSLYKSIFKEDVVTEKKQDSIYSYSNNYNMDYSVNIQKNPFITDSTLPSGQTYVADLIDTLNMHIEYKYIPIEHNNTVYNYKIDAIINADYSDNGEEYSVWNKTYNLKEQNTQNSDGFISIDENLDIPYKKYHQEVKNFKQSMGMTVNATLLVKLTVNTSTTVNNTPVNNEYTSDFSISLGDKIAVVNGKNSDSNSNSIKKDSTIQYKHFNMFSIILNLIVLIISLYIAYTIYFKTKKYHTIKNEYKYELNRILKSCQDRIIMVNTDITNPDEHIIDVNDFGELIKLSEELYKPILCWISDDINNECACFSVISNKTRYRFTLTK